MPFPKQAIRSFTKQDVETLSPKQNGVYGIFNDRHWIYVGRGDIRERMLKHLGGDIPCIVKCSPTGWVAELVNGDASVREKELIVELGPTCNQRVG